VRDDARYAIRLASDDVTFDPTTGWNILASDTKVE
jgi:hypothetical protein